MQCAEAHGRRCKMAVPVCGGAPSAALAEIRCRLGPERTLTWAFAAASAASRRAFSAASAAADAAASAARSCGVLSRSAEAAAAAAAARSCARRVPYGDITGVASAGTVEAGAAAAKMSAGSSCAGRSEGQMQAPSKCFLCHSWQHLGVWSMVSHCGQHPEMHYRLTGNPTFTADGPGSPVLPAAHCSPPAGAPSTCMPLGPASCAAAAVLLPGCACGAPAPGCAAAAVLASAAAPSGLQAACSGSAALPGLGSATSCSPSITSCWP